MADFFDPLLNTGGMVASSKPSRAEVIGTETDFEPKPVKNVTKAKNLFGDDSDDDEPAPKPVLKVKPLSDAIKTPEQPKEQPKVQEKTKPVEEEEADLFTEAATNPEKDEIVSLTEQLAGQSLFEDRPEQSFKQSKAAAIENERLMASVKVKGQPQDVKTDEQRRKEAQEQAEMDSLLDIGGNEDLDQLASGLVDGMDDELLAMAGDGATLDGGVDDGFDFNKYIADNSTEDGSSLFEED